jgi:hypothetical protein
MWIRDSHERVQATDRAARVGKGTKRREFHGTAGVKHGCTRGEMASQPLCYRGDGVIGNGKEYSSGHLGRSPIAAGKFNRPANLLQ